MNHKFTTKTWLRITSAVLALAAMALALLRATLLTQHGAADGGIAVMDALRLIFPLSLSLLFGYIAWKGMFPFNKKHNML